MASYLTLRKFGGSFKEDFLVEKDSVHRRKLSGQSGFGGWAAKCDEFEIVGGAGGQTTS